MQVLDSIFYSFFLVPILYPGILMLVSIFVAFRLRPAKPSRIALAVAMLPSLLMLTLFYSLAIHLHQHLGGWPASIGDQGFPQALLIHEHIALNYFLILLLFNVIIWPVAYILCAIIRRWRAALFYWGIYALANLVCFGAMLFAPSQFWNWWVD